MWMIYWLKLEILHHYSTNDKKYLHEIALCHSIMCGKFANSLSFGWLWPQSSKDNRRRRRRSVEWKSSLFLKCVCIAYQSGAIWLANNVLIVLLFDVKMIVILLITSEQTLWNGTSVSRESYQSNTEIAV